MLTTENSRTIHKMIMIILGFVLLTLGFGIAKAEGGVNMSAQVVERKITDTINDFNFSNINSMTVNPNNQTPININKDIQDAKGVKGVSTYRNFFQRLWDNTLKKLFTN